MYECIWNMHAAEVNQAEEKVYMLGVQLMCTTVSHLQLLLLQVDEVEAVVHGTIPDWLFECLVMNGGGDYSHMRHLFDGYALLSKVRTA